MSGMAMMGLNEATAKMQALYGENKKITDGNYDRTLAVKCINGTFVGKKTENIIAYKGIPFVGKQPVGEYRWKAPVDVTPDDGVYEAYYFGKVPCQVGSPGQMGGLYPQGEDCLHLNIWKADDKGTQKKPVMVWIHGGAYELGGTPEPREEGTSFVQENPDIILVSIEYRLNALGFLRLSHLPDGADYPDSQNLGLMDQLAALKWIHENIEGFGGDSGRVTIFGQSAGGGSVSLLPLVKGAHQYFQRVIQWAEMLFGRKYKKEMKGVEWGLLYNRHKDTTLTATAIGEQLANLMADSDVQKKSGIFAYILDGDVHHLGIRAFDANTRREVYERQGGRCAICGKPFDIEVMEADHITPWVEGGRTISSNCQMLCRDCNRRKSSK